MKNKLAYSYVRFSSKKQEKNDSIRRQEEQRHIWLKNNPEYVLDTKIRLRDLGVSAFKGRNLDPQYGDLGKFIDLIERQDSPIEKGSVLLLEKLDRFSRNEPMLAISALSRVIYGGVKIVVTEDRFEIDRANINDLGVVLPVVMKLCLAHDQSAEKSYRISNYWKGQRAKVIKDNAVLSSTIPSWCYLNAKHKISLNKNKVKAIEYIYQRTIEGVGQKIIVKELNQKFKPIVDPTPKRPKPTWNTSMISVLLDDRRVLGEFQPMTRNNENKRVAAGKLILDYYPQVIPEDKFYAAQHAKSLRKKEYNTERSNFINLFTGLIYNGFDNSIAHLQSIRKHNDDGSIYQQRRWTSLARRQGLKNYSPYTVDYYALEKLILYSLTELEKEDCNPNFEPKKEQIQLLKSIEGYKTKIAELRDELRDPLSESNPVILAEILDNLTKDMKQAEQEAKNISTAAPVDSDMFKDHTNMATLFAGNENTTDINLRSHIRDLLPTIIKRVNIYPYKMENRRIGAKVVVYLRSGRRRYITMLSTKELKTMPYHIYYGLKGTPAIMTTNDGYIFWGRDDSNKNLNWRSTKHLRDGLINIEGQDHPTICTPKQLDILHRVINFIDTNFEGANNAHPEIEPPF